MFVRQRWIIKKLCLTKICNVTKRNVQSAVKEKIIQCSKYSFSEHRKKQPTKNPFLKSLVEGKVDRDCFSMIDVQPIQRVKDFESWLLPISNYITSCNQPHNKVDKNTLLKYLNDLEIFRAFGSEDYNGFNFSETESLKFIESVSALPWLGTHLIKNNMLPVKIISKYGSDSQKQKYLPMILSGQCIPTICLKEDTNETNINHFRTFVAQRDDNTVEVNGEKAFVFNGSNADLFLVFVEHLPTSTTKMDNTSLYLIESNSNGISCKKNYEMIGRHEIPICSVNFDGTVVPNENIVGEQNKGFDIMMDLLKPGNQIIAAQSIAILRNVLNRSISDVMNMKQLDRNLHTFDAVKKILSEAACSLYTMESMAYFTSQLADLYENQDVEIERIITELYCANKCLNSIQSILQVLGAQIYTSNPYYTDMYHNALALTTLDMNNLDANVYIGSAICKHAGIFMKAEIQKMRNSVHFPLHKLRTECKKLFNQRPMLSDYVHQSLAPGVFYLRESLIQIQFNVERLLMLHGTNITNQYLELNRVTEMFTEIYAIIANLSRASRSYSIGLRNSNMDKDIVVCLAYNSLQKINRVSKEIQDFEVLNGDVYHKNMADLIYNYREYPLEHPLNRTVM